MESRTVGILGGGQLGRMMVEACHRLGIKVAILDPGGQSSPAGQLADLVIEGDFNDEAKIHELAAISDILTIEIEHVNTEPLQTLEQSGRSIQPAPSTIKLIQDKYAQKVHLQSHNIALGEFMPITSIDDCHEAGLKYGYPFVLKKRKLAYDGNGNFVIHDENEVEIGFNKLGSKDLYAEKFIPFIKEIAVMVVRTQNNGVVSYPVVETIQKNNICHLVIAPALITEQSRIEAMAVASAAIATLSGCGIFGVELFLLPDDSILLNEIAPRPHNSGHYTMEACSIDQFEMHIRTILNLPCPTPVMRVGAAMMVNILGKSTAEETKAELNQAMTLSNIGLHWYGKKENKLNRKMAHYTITGACMDDVRMTADKLNIPSSAHGLIPMGPKVGIIMGSDSDLPTMKEAAEILDLFQVSYEIKIVSAHRTPSRMYTYAQTASERGIQVIIAGAGGAAHLPGMVAAMTPLPVIGVPIFTTALHGQDSLLSIVQMPRGIPVATVAIGNATNAGLLAVRILASSSSGSNSDRSHAGQLLKRMEEYMLNQESEVLKKTERLETIGYKAYLDK